MEDKNPLPMPTDDVLRRWIEILDQLKSDWKEVIVSEKRGKPARQAPFAAIHSFLCQKRNEPLMSAIINGDKDASLPSSESFHCTWTRFKHLVDKQRYIEAARVAIAFDAVDIFCAMAMVCSGHVKARIVSSMIHVIYETPRVERPSHIPMRSIDTTGGARSAFFSAFHRASVSFSDWSLLLLLLDYRSTYSFLSLPLGFSCSYLIDHWITSDRYWRSYKSLLEEEIPLLHCAWIRRPLSTDAKHRIA